MYPYRVFVSYSHDDKVWATRVVDVLAQTLHLRPVWDEDIQPGTAFSAEIQWKIARAHVFLPLITPNSLSRPWVHQEIGFARGLHVPVLPVAIGTTQTGQMIQELQALPVAADLQDLPKRLGDVNWELLVIRAQETAVSVFECHDHDEGRAMLLGDAARRIFQEMRESVSVRQSGAMTSFCLPAEPVYHRVWDDREQASSRRSEFTRDLKRQERTWLERHAREQGCELIIDPSRDVRTKEDGARKVKLATLAGFLESMKDQDEKVRVVIRHRKEPENVLLLGDWFMARSVAVDQGGVYRQTIATWHAPTVLYYLERFKYEFERLYQEQQAAAGRASSREAAIRAIEEAMKDGQPDPAALARPGV
jgi:hypothetical protein